MLASRRAARLYGSVVSIVYIFIHMIFFDNYKAVKQLKLFERKILVVLPF